MGDLSGIDVGTKIRGEQFKMSGKPKHYVNQISDSLVAEGKYGQKTKEGWYDYRKSRRGKPRQATLDLCAQIRSEVGVSQKTFTPKQIQDRCMYAMICEGFRALEDGVAARPLDIDGIMMFGYGFPVTKGGPMFYADKVGLKKVLNQVKQYAQEYPDNTAWNVPALLQRCVDQRVGVYKYYRNLQKNQRTRAKL